MNPLQVCVAMHDVSPFHQARLERAETLLARWGVEKLLYLLMPNYHGQHPADQDDSFRRWCRRPRSFRLEWFLHGYFHLRVDGPRSIDQIEVAAAQAGQIGNLPIGSPRTDESEFHRLAGHPCDERLARGSEIFHRTLGHAPAGFVAPKWMAQPELSGRLARLGFTWTEDNRFLYHLPTGAQRPAPVITWATRSRVRKQSSLWGCPLLARWHRRAPLLRIAMHPFDFDHPQIVDSIGRIVRQAVATRRQVLYDELLSPWQPLAA